MSNERRRASRRRIIPAALALCFVTVLCLPWTASVGSYGTLVPIPGREAIIRAPDNAALVELHIQPGQIVSAGTVIAHMGNLDLEEQIAQVRTEVARVNTDIDRLRGELGVQQQAQDTAEWQLAQRRREFAETQTEDRQIRGALLFHAGRQGGLRDTVLLAADSAPATRLPAALAAMEAEAHQLTAKLVEAERQLDRVRTLVSEGIAARAELDSAEAKRAALAFDVQAAQQRLQNAITEHRRRLDHGATDVNVARSNLLAARAQASNLDLQLAASLRLRHSLEDRLTLLGRKRAQFVLRAPLPGTVIGEDLPRMAGQYFPKGAEICRIAATHELLVRVQVPEQSLADVAVGSTVHVKTRAFPDRTFQGLVSRIGGESELDGNGQRCYRVELTIRNQDGMLRPGMTVFARVIFGRHSLGWVGVHKLKQALRPELWML